MENTTIRKRSVVQAVKREGGGGVAEPAVEPRSYTGTECSECGRPQYASPSGVTCARGHGAAESKEFASLPSEPASPPPTKRRSPPAVVEASENLERAMREAADLESPTFARANAPAREVPIEPAFGRIIERQFVEDVEATYDRLERALRLSEERGERGHLENALDEAETNARLAFRLLVTFKVEKRRWELENGVVWAAIREEARKVLQKEKNDGQRSKVISDADVEGYAALLHPDEHKTQQLRIYKTEQTVKSMEHLSDVWLLRVKTLQALYGRQR